ncbi:ATP-dependent DNA helicase PIF1-like protein [Tanacetum coccineum]
MTMFFGSDFRQVLPIISNGSWQDIEFSEWILKVEDWEIGEHYDGEVSIDLPEEFLLDAADDSVILASTNEVVDNMNEHLLKKFPGEEMVYVSSDSVDKIDRNAAMDQFIFSPRFINGLKFSGVPNHMLALKVGV